MESIILNAPIILFLFAVLLGSLIYFAITYFTDIKKINNNDEKQKINNESNNTWDLIEKEEIDNRIHNNFVLEESGACLFDMEKVLSHFVYGIHTDSPAEAATMFKNDYLLPALSNSKYKRIVLSFTSYDRNNKDMGGDIPFLYLNNILKSNETLKTSFKPGKRIEIWSSNYDTKIYLMNILNS